MFVLFELCSSIANDVSSCKAHVALNTYCHLLWPCLLLQEGTKAWVAHPRAARVSGVIHFLGGAFAGAAPQLLYNGFIELLADAGYTTIATPYAGEWVAGLGKCCCRMLLEAAAAKCAAACAATPWSRRVRCS
jgi:hypothetical protein